MKILVIGDSCTDVFVYGRCNRLCPEAPIPVFEPSKTITNDGMAGNVVNNLRKLGVETVELVSNYEQITKTRYVDEKSNQMLLRIDSNDKVGNSFDINRVDFESYDAVIVADYDKGYLTYDDIHEIGKQSKFSFIDTKKVVNISSFEEYTFVKMNEVEWDICLEHGAKFEDWKEKLIVTLGDKGCTYNKKIYSVDNTVEVRDLSGAGDTWMASFVYKFIETKKTGTAINYANDNATLVVQKKGVSSI